MIKMIVGNLIVVNFVTETKSKVKEKQTSLLKVLAMYQICRAKLWLNSKLVIKNLVTFVKHERNRKFY